jgi:hypothetical protein
VSETDSFIDEVSEEVRKDRLFAIMRKYGWIAVLAVFLVVSGTAYREYSISANAAKAQQTGDAILAALELETDAERAEALGKIDSGDQNSQSVLSLLQAAELSKAEQNEGAALALQSVDALAKVDVEYRELAEFKKLLFEGSGLSDEQRLADLTAIATSASAYRLLAQEQIALIELGSGQTEAAINRLSGLMEDASVSEGLRQRASQLMIVLGRNPDQIEQ